MKGKGLLAAFLLAVGLCFVPAFGYGEVRHGMWERNATKMEVSLLEARVTYMMYNPTNFLSVRFLHDPVGIVGGTRKFPEGVDTENKIYVEVRDNRDVFSYKSGIALLDEFKIQLEAIYSFVQTVATDMDADIVAKFYSEQRIPLGYFYQGEYYLWPREKQAISEPSKRPKRSYSGLGGGHWIAEKIERGRQIKLEDGSLWKISVRHRLKTMLWETSQKITVAENDDLLYPYRLINQNTGDAVEATFVSE